MAINVASTLTPLYQNFNMRFLQAIRNAEAQKFADRIAMTTQSNTREEHYPLFDRMPGKLREWVGERQKQGGNIFDYALRNKRFETTINIKREDIEDSQLNLQLFATEGAGYQVATWPEQMITNVLENVAPVAATYDGQPFFSAAHPLGDGSSTVQSNLFNTATGSARPFSAANLAAGLQAATSLKGADNAPLGFTGRRAVMVPTSLEWNLRTVLNTAFIAPTAGVGGGAANIGQSNVLQGAADPIVNPWLTSPTAWYILDIATPLKPFIFQQRTQPEFQWLNQPGDSNVFWHDDVVYGVRVRGNAGLGLWFMAMKFDV